MRLKLARLCFLIILVHIPLSVTPVAQGQQLEDSASSGITLAHATSVSGLTPASQQKDLRLLAKPFSGGGVEVTWVDGDSPTKTMVLAENPGVTGTLEIGDVIVAVNGMPVQSMRDLYGVLRGGQSTVVLKIKDVRTDQELDWRSSTISVQVPRVVAPALAPGIPRVHCIYAVLTSDPELGTQIEKNVPSFTSLVSGLIAEDRLASFTTLDGSKCTAEGIRNAIASLDVQSSDSVFFYYQGHGAYDPAHAANDPSFGHHLQLPDEGLLRKEVLFRISAKHPRMTVLVTDCCNVESKVKEPRRAVAELVSREISGWTSLEELLLCYRGVVDLSATSRGEYAWYDDAIGGWFTDVFKSQCYSLCGQQNVNWDMFLNDLGTSVEKQFQDRKAKFSDPLLSAQQHMSPTVFTINAVREEPPGSPPGLRTILVPVTVLLPPPESGGNQ